MFQVAEVTKTLGAVRRMTEAGNRVVFDSAGSYVEDKKTGSRTEIKDDNGEFTMDVWVQTGGELGVMDQNEEDSPGFPRLEELI